MYILEKSNYYDKQKYFKAGTYIQFNPLGKKTPPHRTYIENSINIGDKCSCGNDKPYRVDNLKYWGLGFGGAEHRRTGVSSRPISSGNLLKNLY